MKFQTKAHFLNVDGHYANIKTNIIIDLDKLIITFLIICLIMISIQYIYFCISNIY